MSPPIRLAVRCACALRDLLRASAAASVGGGRGAPAAGGRARAGGDCRPSGLRLRVGGRTPLPGGVLALVGAGGVPGGGVTADEANPPRPRHRADTTAGE